MNVSIPEILYIKNVATLYLTVTLSWNIYVELFVTCVRRNLNVSIMEIDERLQAQSNIYSQTPPTNFASLNTTTLTHCVSPENYYNFMLFLQKLLSSNAIMLLDNKNIVAENCSFLGNVFCHTWVW